MGFKAISTKQITDRSISPMTETGVGFRASTQPTEVLNWVSLLTKTLITLTGSQFFGGGLGFAEELMTAISGMHQRRD